MTTLSASFPPSYSDLIATAPTVGGGSDDSGFSFHDLLNVFAPPAVGASNSGFSLHDLFSIINPLQHIPIVSTIYRAVTGDTIKPVERVVGDTIYGGVWGFASSVANIAFEGMTGKDFGDTALAMLEGNDGDQSVGFASNAATPSSAQAAITASVVAPTTVASIAPQLIATAPAPVLQPQAGVLSASANRTPMGNSHRNSALSQHATLAYRKTLALPTRISVNTVPIY